MFILDPAKLNRAMLNGFMLNQAETILALDDTQSTSASPANNHGINPADAITVSEAKTLAVGMTTADTVAAAEAVIKGVGMVPADGVTVDDSAARVANMVTAMSDTVGVTSDSVKEAGVQLSETVRMSDWTKQKKTQNDFTGA